VGPKLTRSQGVNMREFKRSNPIFSATTLVDDSQLYDVDGVEIASNRPSAFMKIDAKGSILDWSQDAEKIFGWTREEIIGKSFTTTIISVQHREKYEAGVHRFLEVKQSIAADTARELMGIKKNGEEFLIEITMSTIKREDHCEFYTFIKDITLRKKIKNDLLSQKRQMNLLYETVNAGNWRYLSRKLSPRFLSG